MRLRAGALPAAMTNPLFADLGEAADEAVVEADRALGPEGAAAARHAGAALRRDELVRLALAELDAIAAGT